MSTEIATTSNNGIQINKEVEQTKGENWKKFGITLYHTELRLQAYSQEIVGSIPAPTDVKQLPEFEIKLAKAKENLRKLKEQRLEQTRTMSAVIDRLMNPEKTVENHIASIEPKLIELKKISSEENKKNQKKLDEISIIKQSVLKHVADMEAQLKSTNLRLIEDAYAFALNNLTPAQLVEIKPGETKTYLDKVKARVTEKNQTIPRPTFTAEFHTPDEVHALINEIFKPKTAQEFIAEFNTQIDLKFADYALAFANKDEALKLSKADSTQAITNIEQEKTQAHVAASFAASAVNVVGSTGIKELKKVYKLDLEETQANAIIVMTAFVANLKLCSGHLRVSKWFDLKVKQMMASLEAVKTADNNFQYTGLTFKEVEKL